MRGRPYAEVIGDPIAHSKSPLIHNFWLGKLEIDAEYRACHVKPEDLEDYFTRRRGDAEWRGCNVTIPHKQSALNFVDDASSLGLLEATNTIAPRDAGLSAWNTDVTGILEPLSQYPLPTEVAIDTTASAHVSIAQIVGAGGAAQAAIYAAVMAGYLKIELFNRALDRAQETAARASMSRKDAYPLSDLGPMPGGRQYPYYGYQGHFLIVNASPMGMAGTSPVPIDLRRYPQDTIVFDMVYAPLETPLLCAARELRMRAVDGLQMLVGQAAKAFDIFFGAAAPREHDAELRALLTA